MSYELIDDRWAHPEQFRMVEVPLFRFPARYHLKFQTPPRLATVTTIREDGSTGGSTPPQSLINGGSGDSSSRSRDTRLTKNVTSGLVP